ncbi:MAG: acyl-CoA dehydrogenase family protein [Candidatus Binatus sp.]|uniref:acyl-CoA dehydrogenase family protein n=1 Tax=Candidatus Binatus sp. TaxID=2811406 RepID=UPI00271DC782|nr:acyl-CoA dehydrogenase family protein [Candidatus Binatus sp.]MDO8431251.1 acyl-CoA dehydrogenase family protein [Candidatus Binatus sp.]
MIDFELTTADQEILKLAHEQALIGQRYARYYDQHEDELPPAEFPEAANLPNLTRLAEEGVSGSSGPRILHSLVILETYGGIDLHRARWGLGNTVLKTVATPAQFDKWKDHTISIAITEPGAGSDPANIRTTATFDRETGEWIINGEKIFISQAESADAAMVFSRFIAPDGSRGMTTFLVEKGTPGFTVGPQLKKLGIRSHDTCNLLFDNCRIPEFNHIKGDFKSTMSVFNDSRPMVGAMALGVARAALDFTREKYTERGLEIDYRGGLRSRSALVDRFIRLEAIYEAALLTVLRSKWLEQQDVPPKVEASIAKAAGGKAARRITQGCIDLLGPEALSEDHPLDRCFRDGRIFDIYEGAGEIQRLIIARAILGYTGRDLR